MPPLLALAIAGRLFFIASVGMTSTHTSQFLVGALSVALYPSHSHSKVADFQRVVVGCLSSI
jgi:hypothetical protein